MILGKCTSCGANITHTQNGNTIVCPYCDTVYSANTPKVEANENSQINSIQSETQQQKISTTEKRPKINFLVCIILFYFGFFPGIIYIGYKLNKQREWDEKYLGK